MADHIQLFRHVTWLLPDLFHLMHAHMYIFSEQQYRAVNNSLTVPI